ncbi:MAG: cyclic nucleotide-binding domain-containing protein [Pseudomonadota bacterium]
MAIERDIDSLAQVDLLSDLPREQLRLLAFGCEELRFQPDRTFFREGSPADCGFVITSGSVELSRVIDGEMRVVKTISDNHMLGELALITETTRLVTAKAVEETNALRIGRSTFRRMLSEHPHSAAMLHSKLSDRLAEFLEDVGRLERRFR